jgi:thioredoxin reductase
MYSSSLSKDATKPLNVLIVGGGIGGLSAAIFLRRAGHTVEVPKRRPHKGVIILTSPRSSSAPNAGQKQELPSTFRVMCTAY